MPRELSIPPDEVARQNMRGALGRNAAELELKSIATANQEPELTEESGAGHVERRRQ